MQKLLQGALRAARKGDKDLARRAFLQVIKRQPENEIAWFGLVTVARDKQEQRTSLQRLLTINSQHKQGLAAAAKVGLDVDDLLSGGLPPETEQTPEPQADTPTPKPDEQDPTEAAEQQEDRKSVV